MSTPIAAANEADEFPKIPGRVLDVTVHWLAMDPTRASKLEEECRKASRLKQLLMRLRYTEEGITWDERNEANSLANTVPEDSKKACTEEGCAKASIGDLCLCRIHAAALLDINI